MIQNIIIILWYISGLIAAVMLCLNDNDYITIKDVVAIILSAVLGLFLLGVWFFIYSKDYIIWRRK